MKSSALSRGILRAREVRVQPYWDTQNFVAASTATISWFQTIGTNTNMQSAGQFPAPRQFLVKGISIYVPQFANLGTAVDFTNMGVITNSQYILTISDKEYLRVLGWMAPGGGGVEGFGNTVAAAASSSVLRNGQALTYNYFHINPSILIPQQQNFKITCTPTAAVATSTIGVTAVLWGTEERAVQ